MSLSASASSSAAAAASIPPPFEMDVSRFDATLSLLAIRVPTKNTSIALRSLRLAVLDLPRIKPVAMPPASSCSGDVRLVLLHQSFGDDLSLSRGTPAMVAAVRSALSSNPVDYALERYDLKTGYHQLSAGEALAGLLPAGAGFDVQTAFEVVGHIAHVNLRDELRPYGALIGRVLLDKNLGAIRTVINKTGVIASEFRTFPMEVLAGDGDTKVDVRHCGARFRFDFRDVYWNSRLQHEHELLVKTIIPLNALVADAAAGVGPFAVPLGKYAAARVFANDLNPASHAALADAVTRNGVAHVVTASCGDARAFLAILGVRRVPFTQAIFNLPATALELCDVFIGLFARGTNTPAPDNDAHTRVLPRAHIYCFARAQTDDGLADEVAGRLLAVLGMTPPTPSVVALEASVRAAQTALEREASDAAGGGHGSDAVGVRGGIVTPLVAVLRASSFPHLLIRAVRNVAPGKHMMCVSFTVPRAVALAHPVWAWPGESEWKGGAVFDLATATCSSSSSSSSSAGGTSAGAASSSSASSSSFPAAKRSKQV
jgi:tRNA (guanine37-N1)-methyltransferase